MPRLERLERLVVKPKDRDEGRQRSTISMRAEPPVTKREYLEIGPPKEEFADFLRVLDENGRVKPTKLEKKEEEEFVDDPSVPPLE